jgi:hypothetical protein
MERIIRLSIKKFRSNQVLNQIEEHEQ